MPGFSVSERRPAFFILYKKKIDGTFSLFTMFASHKSPVNKMPYSYSSV